jgi:hypothetical protein
MTVPNTTVGESDSATVATGASPCPPSTIQATAESDSLPCSGASVQQGTAMVAVAHLHDLSPDVGDANLARAGVTTTNTAKAFVNRVNIPAPGGAGCTPAASTDGCIASSASRTFGSIRLGGLPSAFASPFSGGSGNCGGYFLSIVSYSDAATAAAGYGSPLPVPTAPSGTLYYWDSASSSCVAVALNAITGLDKTYTTTQKVNGTNVTVTINTVIAGMQAGSTSSTETPTTGGSVTRTDASAQVIAPTMSVHYLMTKPAETMMDVTATVNLGTLTVDATYTPAPTAA